VSDGHPPEPAPPAGDPPAGYPRARFGFRRRRRRRRPRGERGRGFVTILPSLLTTGNLAAGFWSITLSMHGELERAALAIVIGGFFDLLDGRVARMANATSRFGAQYDSIADTVAFGVAPAMLAYSAASLPRLGWAGWVIACLYTVCAGLRLARFNVSPGRFPGRFDGLSSPAAAGMMLSSVWFGSWLREQGFPIDLPPLLAGLGVVAVALLMVSPIPYHSFKNARFAKPYRTLVLAVIAVWVIMLEYRVTLFCVGLVYVSSGPLEWLWRRYTGRELAMPATESPTPAETGSGAHP
jgi:CDP-diacylglycerol--serine O-phosphatidyltransferase